MKFLDKHNLAFRKSNKQLYNCQNKKTYCEMVTKFYSLIQDHHRYIQHKDIYCHYLDHKFVMA